VSPTRVSLPRFHVRVGLHIVLFEVCSAFTCVAACTLARSPYVVTAIRRLQTLRLLHVCSGRFRLERSPGGACTHWKSAALSRRTWKAVIRLEHLGVMGLRRFQPFVSKRCATIDPNLMDHKRLSNQPISRFSRRLASPARESAGSITFDRTPIAPAASGAATSAKGTQATRATRRLPDPMKGS
jgi:hypothetical protein